MATKSNKGLMFGIWDKKQSDSIYPIDKWFTYGGQCGYGLLSTGRKQNTMKVLLQKIVQKVK